MLNQHYLDTMFAFDPNTGRVADTNDFMAMLVDERTVLGEEKVPNFDMKLARGFPGGSRSVDTDSPLPTGSLTSGTMKPISELSRLWQYRNGGSPPI
jgi:hypothetical protein